MEYHLDPELDRQVAHLIETLNLTHIPPERVRCVRSRGTKTKRTLARIHSMSKALQHGLQIPASYVIEVLSESYDKLSEEEQIKTLIHELLHIPHSFGGGFRHHSTHVNKRTVDRAYKKYKNATQVSRWSFLTK